MEAKKQKFIIKMLELGHELGTSKSISQDIVIMNDVEILYNNHIKEISHDLHTSKTVQEPVGNPQQLDG